MLDRRVQFAGTDTVRNGAKFHFKWTDQDPDAALVQELDDPLGLSRCHSAEHRGEAQPRGAR